MDLFTISDLQRYSGISVHSIRAWEKRYQALMPTRSEGNTRYYDGNQLRRLLNIVSLMNSKYKISELCSMPDEKLNEIIIGNMRNETVEYDEFLVNQMIASAMEFDEPSFNKVFSKSVHIYGLVQAYLTVIYPALHRVGLLWAVEDMAPAQEHFISNLIRQKLNSAIDLLPVNENSTNRWLLFLPENEFHESGLLMSNYLIRNAGQQSTYLGANVPFSALKETVKKIKPNSLLFFLVSNNDEINDREFVTKLKQHIPDVRIFLAANESRAEQFLNEPQVTCLTSPAELELLLNNLSN